MTTRKQKRQRNQKIRNKNKQQVAHGSINIWRALKISELHCAKSLDKNLVLFNYN